MGTNFHKNKYEQRFSCNATTSNSEEKWTVKEPLALSIMREMGVLPLDETPVAEENKTSVLAPLNAQPPPAKVLRGLKRNEKAIPTRSPFKAFRGDFVLFRKTDFSKPLGEDQFSKLSDEIILHIFKWLPKPVLVKCAAVSKRWNALSCDESLWRRYDFGRKQIKSGTLGTLISRGVSVLRLAMTEIKSPIFVDQQFSGSNKRFSKLQYLDLSMATLSDESLAHLLSGCNLLKKLSLEYCTLNEDCCRYIAQNPDLEVLNAAMCSGFTAAGVTEICSNCTKLNEWNISWTDLSHSSMLALVSSIPASLTRLNMSGHRQCLDDKCVDSITRRCPHLLELDVSDSPLLTTASLLSIVEHCHKLRHLHANRCYCISPTSFLSLQKLPNLTLIELFGVISSESLKAMQKLAPQLKFNQTIFSTIARPTVGMRRTSIWELRVRD